MNIYDRIEAVIAANTPTPTLDIGSASKWRSALHRPSEGTAGHVGISRYVGGGYFPEVAHCFVEVPDEHNEYDYYDEKIWGDRK